MEETYAPLVAQFLAGRLDPVEFTERLEHELGHVWLRGLAEGVTVSARCIEDGPEALVEIVNGMLCAAAVERDWDEVPHLRWVDGEAVADFLPTDAVREMLTGWDETAASGAA